MKKTNVKSKLSTIAIITILTLSSMLFGITSVSAQANVIDPFAYLNAVPNPVEINTVTVLHVGSVYPTPSQIGGWFGLTVEVTKPDGSTQIIGPINTDTTGGTGVVFTPTLIGTYTMRTHFPETTTTANGYYGPSGTILQEGYSDTLELIVTDDPVAYYPPFELPTEYWSRPIGAEMRQWYRISNNWLGYVPPTNNDPTSMNAPFNEYAPETGHVLWTMPQTMGGLAGGTMGEQGFEQGDAYEGKFGSGGLFGAAGPVIIGGVLFINQFSSQGEANVDDWVNAIDLHTGELLWSKPLVTPDGAELRLAFGQTFYWDSYNYHGVFDFLWATESAGFFGPTNWHAFDPFTGRWVYTMEDMPSGVKVYGVKGEIYLYNVNKNAGTMSLWNSSRVVASAGSWRPQGQTYDTNDTADGIEWTVNVTGLADLPGSVYKVRRDVILGSDFARGSPAPNPANMWALSVDLSGDVDVMWHNEWPLPYNNALISVEDVSVEEDLFIVSTKQARTTYGFRLSTGAQIWGPTPSRFYTDNWGHSSGNSWDIILEGYDKVIAGNYGGTVWCYSATNGSVLWTYDIVDPYVETLHGNNWRFRPVFFTDGKLYLENTEHNPRDPQPRGAPFLCLDIETGDKVWEMPYRGSEWSSTAMIADSIIALWNNYDNRFYAIGKGPSSITVSVPQVAIPVGTGAAISGTVMDVSPGTKSERVMLRFPEGVPAVADDHMTNWMTYVYNQYPRPADAVGVEVRIQVVDPNGAYAWIGTATSDAYGNYGYSFVPQMKGTYTIIATFVGSEAYYGAQATAYLVADPAPTPYPTIPSYPGYQGPSAQDVANRVVSSLPANPTSDQIGQAVVNQLPAYPEPTVVPEYTMIDIVIIILVAIAIVIGIVSLLRKK